MTGHIGQETKHKGKPHFKTEDGLLFRYFESECGDIVKQIVIPAQYRNQILHIAHDPPLGGHLGNHKTRNRILNHFYWPGIFNDVANFCRSCAQCQKSVPKGRVGKALLIPIPPMEVPFKRIAMDIVGPLPRSERGNRYVLVICDYATKYPEAIPLKTIDAETVANELIWFISPSWEFHRKYLKIWVATL